MVSAENISSFQRKFQTLEKPILFWNALTWILFQFDHIWVFGPRAPSSSDIPFHLRNQFIIKLEPIARSIYVWHDCICHDCCVFERLFKIQRNGDFIFGIPFFDLEILIFCIYFSCHIHFYSTISTFSSQVS